MKKYITNINWLLIEKVFRLGISFFIGVYIARYLGPEKFGILNYALSFVYLFGAISGLGLRTILVRELVLNDSNKINSLLGTAFILKILVAICLILIINTVNFSLNSSLEKYIVLIISFGIFFQSFQVIDFYFQSKVLSKYIVKINIIVISIISIYKIYLLFIKADLIYFAFSYLLESLLLAVGFILVYKKQKFSLFKWKFDKYIAFKLLKDSWPLMLSGIVINIYMKIDQVMIKYFLSLKDVGIYAVATKLVEMWYFIPTILSSTFAPAIVNAYKRSLKLFNNRLIKLYSLYFWLSILITILIIISAKFLILILFGNQYVDSIVILQLYSLSLISTFVGMATSQYLIAKNLTKLSFYRTLIGMFVNVILNVLLIPKYGIIGATVATIVSYTIATFSMFFYKDAKNQFIYVVKGLNPLYLIRRK